MTWKAVKLTAGVGFVGSAALEFTLRGQTVVTAAIILKDTFDGCGRGRSGADQKVSINGVPGSVTRQGSIALSHASPWMPSVEGALLVMLLM
jgi:hypothetical protein